uniref:Uncharacterized protein n=1 Tax=Arundo donax TaxID=35708 RepID=A0A0A9B1F1_ARUDO
MILIYITVLMHFVCFFSLKQWIT